MIGVILTGALFIVTGILAMMYGQKLFSMFLSIYAFSLTFGMITSQSGQSMTTLAIALAVAVVAAILAQYAPKAAFFLLGFVVGLFLSGLVLLIMEFEGSHAMMVLLIAGILMGILSAHFDKVFIRLGTSFLGAKSLSTGLLFFIFNITNLYAFSSDDLLTALSNTSSYLSDTFSQQYSTHILIATLIFTCIGYYYQSTRKKRRRR